MPLTPVTILAAAGILAGLALVWRGMQGYRLGIRVADVGTSRIASLAAGEVRVHGTVEPAEVTLVSPLTSATCVWYRARIERFSDESQESAFEDERGIGFRVRDETGTIRVFPRGASLDVPDRFDESTGMLGDEPPGLRLRAGGAYGPGAIDTPQERDGAAAALLTVRVPPSTDLADFGRDGARRRHRFVEARLEPGDEVTVVGSALPFGHLADPAGADVLTGWSGPGAIDEETAASVAEAREAGLLVSPDEAWGNAAIPGFGIGRPVTAPTLDPAMPSPVVATREEADAYARTFDLAPDLLVLAAAPDAPLVIAAGSPGAVQERQQSAFLVGLLGAVLAIGSAVTLALLWSGAIAG